MLLLINKRLLVPVVFLSVTILSSVAFSQISQNTKPAQIDKNGLLLLVRSTLYALDLSNKSGNYTILREISAPGFASAHDASNLSQIFGNLRARGVDLSGILVFEPQLTVMPEITKEGMMHFSGFFPSASNQIKFEMMFAPVNGQWKLFGLAADVGPAGPIAPINVPQQSQQQPVPVAKPSAAPAQKK